MEETSMQRMIILVAAVLGLGAIGCQGSIDDEPAYAPAPAPAPQVIREREIVQQPVAVPGPERVRTEYVDRPVPVPGPETIIEREVPVEVEVDREPTPPANITITSPPAQ